MSAQLDSILERSRTPGRFVERRRFTLSRDKAVEKLREFSLRHPEQYILELVQAAVFAGARWIAIDVSAERLFFAWVGGRSYKSDELANVFDYLFADRAAMETRHVVQLAVALNALLQRNPKVVRIESGDGTSDGTVRMDVDRLGKGHLGRPEDSFQGTYLVVEHATSWFSRFDTSQWTREQALVEERCLYSPVPILLNYRAPFGYRANRELKLYGPAHSRSFDEDGRRGVLGLPDEGDRSADGVRIVVGGVWVTTRPIVELGRVPGSGGEPLPLLGVIADDRLRKTADQSDVVEDGRWIDMLHAVQPIATQLIEKSRAGRGYTPPPLPRRVDEAPRQAQAAGPKGPPPQPLPEPLPQVAPRPSLELDQLNALPAGSPIFWVDPETAGSLGISADPDRFGVRLLVLTPGQVVTLNTEAPGLSLGAITSAADAEFVTRVMARQARVREVVVPLTAPDGFGSRGRLRLRLHEVGARPEFGVEGIEDVPVVVRLARRAVWCGSLHLALPGVSVVVELDGGRFDGDEGAVIISHFVRRNAWRLLADPEVTGAPGLDDAPLGTPVRALAVALLAMGATPTFFREGDELALAATLPRAWGPLSASLRTLPLAATAAGPLTFDGLLALLAAPTPAVVELLDADDLLLLAPLEQRLGYGHLTTSGSERRALLAVAQLGGGTRARWTRWHADQATPGPQVEAVLWLADGFDARLGMAGWRDLDAPLPGIGLAVRDRGGSGPVVDLRDGLNALAELLGHLVREDGWEQAVPEAVQVDRARQLGRLALIHLATEADDGEARVLPSSDGATWHRLRRLSPAPDQASLRVAARHGPRLVEADTVLLSWDEIQAIRRSGRSVPLRFDDAPEVWDSLVAERGPSAVEPGQDQRPSPAGGHGWLLRERLSVPGLEGWLGLRWPYDPTTAVLIQQSGELLAMSQIDRHVPCHGLAWTTGATDRVGRVQRDLLGLARLRLYQRLEEQLATHADPAWRAVAECYAIDFAVHAWRSHAAGAGDSQGSLGGTASRLLDRLRLSDDEGRPLGALGTWLGLPVDHRGVPAGHCRRYQSIQAEPTTTRRREGDYEATLTTLERRLARVLSLASAAPDLRVFLYRWEGRANEPAVRIRDEGSGHGMVSLDLNEHHSLVYTALADPGQAREIVLLEAVRLGCQVVRERGGSLDLLHAHQLLAAQRL